MTDTFIKVYYFDGKKNVNIPDTINIINQECELDMYDIKQHQYIYDCWNNIKGISVLCKKKLKIKN